MILSKKEAVETYGTPSQVKHFEKYGKFVSKKTEESLIRTLKQHFEQVEKIKQGRAYMYSLNGRRSVIADREDDRSTNGAHLRTPYSFDLDLAIITYMEANRDKLETYNPKTPASWLLELGLVTKSMHDVYLSKYDERNLGDQFGDMIKNNVLIYGEKRTLRKYIEFHENLKRNLETAFSKLVKKNILSEVCEYWAFAKHYDNVSKTDKPISSGYVKLLASEYVKIKSDTRHILLSNDVSYFDINYKNKEKESQIEECKKELAKMNDSILKPLYDGGVSSISYTFIKKSYSVKATPKQVVNYIKKNIATHYNGSERIDLIIREMIKSYEENSTYANYLHTMSSFQDNKRIALLNKAKQTEKKFKEYIDSENSKISDAADWGGVFQLKEEPFVESSENGVHYQSLLNGSFSERMLGIDSFLQENPRSLKYRKESTQRVLKQKEGIFLQ